MREAQENPMADPDLLPVGHRRENEVHLGNNVFLDHVSMSNVLCNSTSPSQFVGNLIVAKFSEQVLKVSTLSGNISNRQIGRMKQLLSDGTDQPKNKKDNGQEDNEKSKENKENKTSDNLKTMKLDQTILRGCKLYYKFWLETHYPDLLTEKMKKTYDSAEEYRNFNAYVSTKISNLKKPKEKSKAKKDTTKDNGNEIIIKENDLEPDYTVLPQESLMFVATKESDSEVDESDLRDEEDDDPLQNPVGEEEKEDDDTEKESD